jgi:hypothetical protein
MIAPFINVASNRASTLTSCVDSNLSLGLPDQFPRLIRRGLAPLVAAIFFAILGDSWLSVTAGYAANEICTTCGPQVSVSGDFAHRKESATTEILGTGIWKKNNT